MYQSRFFSSMKWQRNVVKHLELFNLYYDSSYGVSLWFKFRSLCLLATEFVLRETNERPVSRSESNALY